MDFSTLWTYPWDLLDDDPRALCRRFADTGLDAVSLASAYHCFDQVRPNATGPIHLQSPNAAAYFVPDMDHYPGPIRPEAAERMQGADWWETCARAAGEAGLDLVAWTVFCHNSKLAQAHPRAAQVSCTGDLSTSHLCPANPDVVAYASGLARDLSRYGISTLECESLQYGGWGHTHFHPKVGVDLGPGGRFLLSLCFCDACRSRGEEANLDVAAIAADADRRIRHALTTGTPIAATVDALSHEIPGLSDFLLIRAKVVLAIIRAVADASSVPLACLAMGDPSVSGLAMEQVVDQAARVEILAYSASTDAIASAVRQALGSLVNPDRLLVGLQAYPPAATTADDLCEHVQTLRALSIRQVSFYNYGIMPAANLDWIARALAAR